jgi:hypothetical protein
MEQPSSRQAIKHKYTWFINKEHRPPTILFAYGTTKEHATRRLISHLAEEYNHSHLNNLNNCCGSKLSLDLDNYLPILNKYGDYEKFILDNEPTVLNNHVNNTDEVGIIEPAVCGPFPFATTTTNKRKPEDDLENSSKKPRVEKDDEEKSSGSDSSSDSNETLINSVKTQIKTLFKKSLEVAHRRNFPEYHLPKLDVLGMPLFAKWIFGMLHECLNRKETRVYLHFDMVQGTTYKNIVCSLNINYIINKPLALRFIGPDILGVAKDDVVNEIVTSHNKDAIRYFPCSFIRGILPEETDYTIYETKNQRSMYFPNYTLEIKLNFTL